MAWGDEVSITNVTPDVIAAGDFFLFITIDYRLTSWLGLLIYWPLGAVMLGPGAGTTIGYLGRPDHIWAKKPVKITLSFFFAVSL